MIIRMRHIRTAALCSRGVKAWFERHDLDYLDFLKNGIDSELFVATGDALALRVVAVAEKEVIDGQ